MSVIGLRSILSQINRCCNTDLRSHRKAPAVLRSARPIIWIILFLGAFAWADLCAFGQDASERPLEPINIEAPEWRARSRDADSSRSPGFDESDFADQPASDTRPSTDRAGLGSILGRPGMSVVTDKPNISLNSAALPAQVQIVTRQEIERLNIRNYTDLFKKVAGVRAYSQGQGDVGFVISMRGFAGQHGKDVGIFIDGVPQNMPSPAQWVSGQAEWAWLAPEAIERIEIIKGPFSALYGDFALAGVINIITRSSQPYSSLTPLGGSFGEARGLATISSERYSTIPFLVEELYRTGGYRDNSNYNRATSFNKVTFPLWGANLSLRFNYFNSNAATPGFLAIDDVRNHVVPRTAAVNETDGVWGPRYGLVMNYAPRDTQEGLYAVAYVEKYEKNRFGTYPPGGQIAMIDDRMIWGGRFYYNLVYGDVASVTAGFETRQDSGAANQYVSVQRQQTAGIYDYSLRLSNWAWFVQGQIKIAEPVKIVGGVRGDYFTQQVENINRPINSGTAFPKNVSPKIGVSITPTANFNIFANKGLGFRSPAASELSPGRPFGRKNFDLNLAEVDSADVGFNAVVFDNIFLSAAGYWTELEREVRMISGRAIPVGDTERKGYELEAKFYAPQGVTIFANYAYVDATVKNPKNPGQTLVPAVSENDIKGGIEIERDFGAGRRLVVDAYYAYVSGFPVYYQRSTVPMRTPAYDVYNMKVLYEENGWNAFLAARFQPRQYASEMMGLRDNGMLEFDPQPAWDFRGGLTLAFW